MSMENQTLTTKVGDQIKRAKGDTNVEVIGNIPQLKPEARYALFKNYNVVTVGKNNEEDSKKDEKNSTTYVDFIREESYRSLEDTEERSKWEE